ncbi:hypothetical protein Droror1_Dr00013309 [Drosera rotundifolia]
MFEGVKPFKVEFSSVGNSIGGSAMKLVRVGVVGVGTCASVAVRGVEIQLLVVFNGWLGGCLAIVQRGAVVRVVVAPLGWVFGAVFGEPVCPVIGED